MIITGGMVAFEDGIKKSEEYAPPKKARVELKFDVPEGADADAGMEDAAAKAMGLVGRMLAGATDKDKLAAAAQARAASAKGPEVVERKKPGPQKKAEAPKAEPKPATASAASVVEEPETAAVEEAIGDPASMSEFDSEPQPISDQELVSAMSKKNATLKNAQKIRDLVGTYNPDKTKAFQSSQIPQAQRRDFLAKLEALT